MEPDTTVIGSEKADGLEYATIVIDGHKYTLAYDFNKICDAEILTGVNLLEALETLSNVNCAQFRGLLYAALEAGPESTWPKMRPAEILLAVGKLIRLDTLQNLTKALAKAYNLSVSHDEAEDSASEDVLPSTKRQPPQPEN